MNNKGQGAIEYLLIIGTAILVVIIAVSGAIQNDVHLDEKFFGTKFCADNNMSYSYGSSSNDFCVDLQGKSKSICYGEKCGVAFSDCDSNLVRFVDDCKCNKVN